MNTRSPFAFLAAAALALGSAPAASTIDPAHPYAYGANIGWVNGRADTTNGAVIGRFYCSGWLYAANAGWISLGGGAPSNGHAYANTSAADYGVNHDGFGRLRGYAYGANIGWLAFETNGDPRVDLHTGNLLGYVWGANIGWISLSNAQAYVRTQSLPNGPDTDGDGLPDPWEYRHTNELPVLSGNGDADGDGRTDREEWIADTDPLDNADFLRAVSLTAQAETNTVGWTCRPTRLYQLESTTALTNSESWADVGPGLLDPDPSGIMRRTLGDGGAPVRSYRAKALLPLAP